MISSNTLNLSNKQPALNKCAESYSSFGTGRGAVERFYALTAEPGLNFEEELRELLARYDALSPDPGSAFMLRFHVSDIATQAHDLARMTAGRNAFISVVGQPPANGARVALEAWQIDGLGHGSFDGHEDGSMKILNLQHYNLMLSRSSKLSQKGSYNQTLEEFDNLLGHVSRQGGTLEDNVHRTWIYCRDIDNNYHGMVEARTHVFNRHGLSKQTHYIASTGIEAQNDPTDRIVSMDSLSFFGLRPEQVEYMSALDHLSPTHEYGVTFERATRLIYGDRSSYYISGTASIDHKGEICHHGDVVKQTERTLENISALLENHGGNLADMAQATVYLRDPADWKQVAAVIEQSPLKDTPYIMVKAPVCRPGWLVEIDGIAVNGNGNDACPVFI